MKRSWVYVSLLFTFTLFSSALAFSQDQNSGKDAPAKQADVDELKTKIDKINEESDWSLVLGVGSLVTGPEVTDYTNDSNVLHTTNLGRATPQLLTGVAFRTKIPNFRKFSGDEAWQKHPWNTFLSLKFSPSSSQTLSGYVVGGSYSIAHHFSALIGFALTPVSEPSPGFRVTASQFVTDQQKLGQYMNFDPVAMLRNKQNAFDGFPVADQNGKLIYPGSPTTVHYRGGAVFGISTNIEFKSVFAGK